MAETVPARIIKTAAKRLGISVEQYVAMRAQGLKHCRRCRLWLRCDDFGKDLSRGDGYSPICEACRKRATYRGGNRFLSLSDADAARQRYRRWYAKGGARFVRQRVHARQRGTTPIPPIGQEHLIEWFDGVCAYCQNPATTFDHIVPLSRGGLTEPGNIVPACRSCNSSKRDRLLTEWLGKRGRAVPYLVTEVIALLEGGFDYNKY